MKKANKDISSLSDFSIMIKDLCDELRDEVNGITNSNYFKLKSQYGVSELIEKIRGKIDQLNDQNFKILVVGEFKKGKSTFINSLLGVELLPAYSRPCTDVVNEICWGDKEKIVIQKADQKNIEIKREDFEKYVTIGGEYNSDDNKTKMAQVFYPVEYCLNGVSIVDTPGLNEDVKRNNTTLSYLSCADAVIFMLSADQPCSMTEMFMIEELVKDRGFKHVFFVCNRINIIRAKEVEVLKKYIIEKLKPYLLDGQKVYFIDALNAMESKIEGKSLVGDYVELELDINEHLINNRALFRAKNIVHELVIDYTTAIERVKSHIKHMNKDLDELNNLLVEQDKIQLKTEEVKQEILTYWNQRRGEVLDQFVNVVKLQFESGSIEKDIRSNVQNICAMGRKDIFNDVGLTRNFMEGIIAGWLRRNMETQMNNSFNVILENEISKMTNIAYKHISQYFDVEESSLLRNDMATKIYFDLSNFFNKTNLTIILDVNQNERNKNKNMLIGSVLFSAIDLAFTGGGASLLLTSLTGISAGAFFSKDVNDHSEFVNYASNAIYMQLSEIKNQLFVQVKDSISLVLSEVDAKISNQIINQLDSVFKMINHRQMECQLTFEEREKNKLDAIDYLSILNSQQAKLGDLPFIKS